MADGEVVIRVGMETKRFDNQIKEVESELKLLETRYKEIKNMKPYKGQEEDLKQLGLEIEKVNNKLVNLNQQQKKSLGFTDVNKELNTTDKKLSGILKKVGKWALAVFGVRSAYMLIRRAMSTLTQYNEQLATDLDYINFAVAKALEPIIEYIVKLVYELLGLLNKVTKALFGYDMFANAGADSFKRANNNAKQLQKTLSGFDEVNVLGQNTQLGGGNNTPSIIPDDTSELENFFNNIQIKFDVAFGKIKEGIITKLREAFGLDGDTIQALNGYFNSIELSFDGLFKTLDGIMTLIIGVLTLDPEKITQGWNLTIEGIGDILRGFVGFSFGWKETLLGYAEDFVNGIETKFGPIGSIMIAPIKNAITTLKNLFTGLKTSIGDIINGIVKIFQGDLGGLEDIGIGIVNALIDVLNTLINNINAIATPIRALIVGIGKVLGKNWTLDNIRIPNINYIKSNGRTISGGIGRHAYTGAIVELASGGLVNLPGRGVPIGNAITGERGKEGVIPLTNQQAMEQLGQAIGKYINLNATVPIYLGNRLVAKELKQINAENDFAFNRS